VATGNWGCGAFGGDPRLKALIQLMAAAHTGVQLDYFTFGDVQLSLDIERMYAHLVERDVNVGDIFQFLWSHVVTATSLAEAGRELLEQILSI